jgi:hypothetical protein
MKSKNQSPKTPSSQIESETTQDAAADVYKDDFAQHLSNDTPSGSADSDPYPEPPVSARAIATLIGYCAKTVERKARDGVLPGHPIGKGPRKKHFFFISEVLAAIRSKGNCDKLTRRREAGDK